MSTETYQQVKDYYGKVLSSSNDLQTNACCSAEAMPKYLKEILSELDTEVLSKFYGCGSPLPPALDGQVVLDLGCGTGRDVFVCSKLVGSSGRVIGIDMTEEQLEVARRHANAQAERFGFSAPNTEFHQGYIEDLASAGIEDNSVDVVISNCVINLSPKKEAVFSEIFRVLKPGGELYFSDVFSDRRLPEWMKSDDVLLGECLGGAMYDEDFRRLLEKLGCKDFRVISSAPITVENSDIQNQLGEINFSSITIRAFKLDSLEDRCEDYGQVATYKGTIAESPASFVLDDHHVFEAHRPMLVCGNTASMIAETRFAEHFEVQGDRTRHFGLFPCDEPSPAVSVIGGSCC